MLHCITSSPLHADETSQEVSEMNVLRRVIQNYVSFFRTIVLRKKKVQRKDENPFIYPHF